MSNKSKVLDKRALSVERIQNLRRSSAASPFRTDQPRRQGSRSSARRAAVAEFR